ncbi:uncharacterized protein LOC141760337 [Sebastes fasciatus]|uniref:uncharacterized protein LOC141760337 n=1 Tax=Sebastes fasciatus TaxID=394691 RepID=UPI003D9F23CC
MGQALMLPSSSELMTEIDELLKSEEAWAAKYNAMKELSENISGIQQSWEMKLQELEDGNKDLSDKLDLAEKDRKLEAELQERMSQLEQLIDQRDAEILDLSKQATSLSQGFTEIRKKLLDKGDELVDCEETWEVKCREQKAEFYKVLDEKDQFYMARIKRMQDCKEKLQDKFNADLAESDQGWMTRVKQMDDETTLLEDICLDMKKKMRGFFSSRRMEDRRTSLQEMKRKMRKKWMEKKEEEQEAEEKKVFFRWMFRKKKSDCESQLDEEAAGCSAQVEEQ